MATSHLLSIFILALISLSPIGQAKRDTPSEQKPSPFEFIKTLQGCHKGNKTKDIHHLKNYLHQFGYLQYPNETHANNDDFDETLESAIKTYQRNYHINPTGTLDATTVSKMTTPRCGVPDIINGRNTMQKHGTKGHESNSSSKHIHTVSHYSFFRGNPRWPPSKTHLTYRFLPNTPAAAVGPVSRAFQKWASSTHFTFSLAQNSADLVIGFHRGDHGDGFPFDGGTLAHAFAPTNGRFHYDADELWSVGPVQDAFDLETVALHEIGHLLGLDHSSVEAAIMYPRIPSGRTKGLNTDDIQGIRALYNV
ncbi:PREDICTED: metalloendoproteinase 1-like isoform X2 [Erythranthe guttata]|nr:PREDICTED: metalloendoproteinase 1-like isoform X2 [Erythranthe guttata]|eukprot:XP_012840653.1 PREDICTED: metalloendoproteinase 1-like isoform X2 [Erythranthe guttata]